MGRCAKTEALVATQLERQQRRLQDNRDEQATIESRRRLFKHDVELDSIFNVLKVGLALAITFVLKEYLETLVWSPSLSSTGLPPCPRVCVFMPNLEILTFDYNHRDPDVMALLAEHCAAINARGLLTRSGRKLRIQVDPAPPPARPPTGRRTKSGDRSRRS